MRPNVEKVDSEVQGFKVCVRCETRVDEALSECPECGARLQGLGLIDNVSDSVHADLSMANLARMRADYKTAEQQCLSILKQYPHHFETHVLMGDVFADQSHFEQAAQWYELAVDLDPGSFIARQKLQVMSDRLKEMEKVNTAEQLGLPEMSGKRTASYAALALGIIGLCAFVAYSLGRQTGTTAAPDVVRSSISATQDSVFLKPNEVVPGEQPPIAAPPTPVLSPYATAEDKATTETLRRGEHGDRLVQATIDPRTKQLTIMYRVQEGESERVIGAQIARDALGAIGDSALVTLRALRGDQTVYMADVPRSRLAESQTEAWQAAAAAPDAWIQHILTNEWSGLPASTPQPAP